MDMETILNKIKYQLNPFSEEKLNTLFDKIISRDSNDEYDLKNLIDDTLENRKKKDEKMDIEDSSSKNDASSKNIPEIYLNNNFSSNSNNYNCFNNSEKNEITNNSEKNYDDIVTDIFNFLDDNNDEKTTIELLEQIIDVSESLS